MFVQKMENIQVYAGGGGLVPNKNLVYFHFVCLLPVISRFHSNLPPVGAFKESQQTRGGIRFHFHFVILHSVPSGPGLLQSRPTSFS